MTEAKSARTVRRGRIFPEIQWTEEQKAQWNAEREAFKQRCKFIFDQVKPELIKTHYNWYMAVEPDSEEYFIHEDVLLVAQMAQKKYPNARLHVFRINETGACGRI
jgi:hypothetical protein